MLLCRSGGWSGTGGLSPDGPRWMSCLPGCFLPVRILFRLFRRLFLEALEKAFKQGQLEFFSELEPVAGIRMGDLRQTSIRWPPTGARISGPLHHRVAISN